ncbi:MAG: chemotaxis protein CheA [Desulfonatronovibrio sp. MSAO_Bac4]|nr:MAG: chemotaxis protein CheA [Desulfonatronovibrio sp. MSAO_Bac4]
MNQDFFDPEVYSDFVIEAREHLETIEPKLLELEKNPDDLSILDDIFRPMHSLKGASGFLGLKEMNSLAHKGENILDELRRGRMKITSSIMDLILEATDALREMVDSLEAHGNEGSVDTSHIISHIDELLQGGGSPAPSAKQASKPEPPPKEEKDTYGLTLISQDHLSDFVEEVQESLSEMSGMLLKLEKDLGEDKENINNLFRSFHNIKGNSAIIGFTEINSLSHEAETILNWIRNNELEISQELIDLLLTISDTLELILNNVDHESAEVKKQDISGVLKQVQEVIKGKNTASQDESVNGEEPLPKHETSVQQTEKIQVKDQDADDVDPDDLQIFEQAVGQQFENMKFALEKIESGNGDKEVVDGLYRSLVTIQNSTGYMGFEDLKTYSSGAADLVDQGRNSDLDFTLMVDILKQEMSILESMIQKKLQSITSAEASNEDDSTVQAKDESEHKKDEPAENVSGKETEPEQETDKPEESPAASADSSNVPPKEQAKTKDKSRSAIASTIRVEHSRLDDLMNLIGELIINRNRFSMLSKSLEEGHDVVEIAQQLTETTNSMARISDDLQVTIMNVRMVPVQTVFTKFPRLVRDLSRKSNKNVQLITEGEETELDKSVVELIGDPLVHLIRNSVDHGIESEEKRIKAGKDATGTVWLRAAHRGNSVVIEVEDDGGGIDPEKMKAKAVEKNIITQEKAQNMEDQEAVDLIFAPGFSTAEKVTDISGRGVGMDVVKNNIKNLKGSVIASSNLGKGTRFSITLPLTLAIIDALIVKVAGQTYAIPLDAVSETTKIEASKLSEINNRKAVTLRGEVLGLADLGSLLDFSAGTQERDVLPVVIIHIGDRRLGLVVDTLLERQEVVIKSLGEYMGDQPGISGATIMGDGRVVLILDPHEIYKMATNRH